jgi:hypothetical protein
MITRLGAAFILAALAQASSARGLPMDVVQEICTRFEDKPLYVTEGETVSGNCPYINKLAEIEGQTALEGYREILASAKTLAGLRTPGLLPSDVDCAGFKEQVSDQQRVVRCATTLPGGTIRMDFVADAKGNLRRLETTVNYLQLYSSALDRSVTRGKLTRYFPLYPELQTELIYRKQLFTAQARDKVVLRGGILTLSVAAP